ncbi:OstA-like protein (organic solvent tolerance) [Candidatus Blochmanniella floridana]|uniref:OstA-like protein (Organic solvent tolerance) n=1 Tax=Blochmanniella floridana TaxID=203907 RepID=Q7VQS3_BLOFL|nr:OstA-like protein (organic solvent tolerance) [Candidatus Blochmannia floridanus]
MKFRICNKLYIIIYILINILIFLKNFTYANSPIIEIHSEYQSINKLTNVIHFTDNVICKYKNIKLYADKVIITHNQKKYKSSILTAYGHPATIHYIQTSKNITSASAEVIFFDSIDNIITFSGNAHIKYLGNSIYSDNIIYSINQKKIQAISNQNNQTTTILSIYPTS